MIEAKETDKLENQGNIGYLTNLFRRRASMDIMTVFFSRVISSGLSLFSVFIIARELGVDDFGIFFFGITVLQIISEVIGNCINITFIRFYSASIMNDEVKGRWILRFSLKANLIIGIIIGLGCYFFANPIAIGILGKPELVTSLRFVAFGSLGFVLWGFTLSILYARQSFLKSAVMEIGYNVIKVIFIVNFYLSHVLNVNNSFIIFFTAPYVCNFISLLLLPRSFWKRVDSPKYSFRKEGRQLFHFNKWLVISSIFYTIYARLGFLMLSHFKDMSSVSIYSAAMNLSIGVDLIIGSLMTILMPRVSKFGKREEYIYFIKHFLVAAILLSLTIIALTFMLSKPLIIAIYATEFAEAAPILTILVAGNLFLLITAPLSIIFYAMNKPQILTYLDIIVFVLTFTIGLYLVPVYGIYGAAYVNLITRVLIALYLTVVLHIELRAKYEVQKQQN